MSTVLERKIKPDGTVREYRCEWAGRGPGLAILRFVVHDPASFHVPVPFPAGTVSHGYFWTRRHYNVYCFRSPEGRLLAHRFDAVADVALSDDEVRYRDLVLDWWALADGLLIEEDRDELDALVAAGAFSERDQALARSAARQVFSRYRHIIDEVEALEAKFGL